jgi:protein-tyrosine-phosphatase
MAMAIFNNIAGLEPPEFKYEAISAGFAVSSDDLPSTNAVLVMNDLFGIDISKHHPHLLSRAEVEEAFLVLTMTGSHKHCILSMFPGAYQKVFTLKEYAYDILTNTDKSCTKSLQGFSSDISDPYGSSLWFYKLCAQEIEQAVEKLVEKLKKI